MTESPNVIATRILGALAEAEEFGAVPFTWYGYVTLEDVRALAEAVTAEHSGERWTSVFFRYGVEHEETHRSLEDALKFLHDGWYTAERSPVAIKGPDGEVLMDAVAIDDHRQSREPKEP